MANIHFSTEQEKQNIIFDREEMRVLIVTTEIGSKRGGLALACQRVVDLLAEEHDIEVVLSSEYPVYTAKGGMNPIIEDNIRKECKLKYDYSKHADTDVIVAFGGRFNGYYSAQLASKMGKRFILALRGSDANIAKWSVEDTLYLREAAIRANQVICLSEEMIQNVLSICPEANGKMLIIPNEYEGLCSEFSFHDLSRKIIIGVAASHLNEKKGIGNLLKMLVEFKKISSKDIRLELVGEIDINLLKDYKRVMAACDLEYNVVFVGYQTRDTLRDTMKEWDFYIQASVCEGHPNSISECLSCGTGFISTKTGYVAERLQNLFPEFFFENLSPRVMAKRLKVLSETSDLPSRYLAAFNELKRGCAKEDISRRWLDLLSYNKTRRRDIDIENIVCVALHDVKGDMHDSITTPIKVFRDFVDYVANQGYGICSMHDYLHKPRNERRQMIVCTFDDGYKSLTHDALQILKRHGFTATVFVCTDLIGKDNAWNNKDATLRMHLDRGDLQFLKSEGWEIASHGVFHKNLLKLSDLEIEYELEESKKVLEQLMGYCETFAYPYGTCNKFICQCVSKYYSYAFSVDHGGTSMAVDRYQLKRYSITEIYNMLKQG